MTPKEAFHNGNVSSSIEVVDDTEYHVLEFAIPKGALKKTFFLKKYFAHIDTYPEDSRFRRRQHWCEWGETVCDMFDRVNGFLSYRTLFVAGSRSVSVIPWAIFGKSEHLAQHQFHSIRDLSHHYRNLLHGQCRYVKTYHRSPPTILDKITRNQKVFPLNNPNFWMGVAICLTYDLIHNCAPDVAPTLDLFTNDYRINVNEMPLDEWNILRCRLLGVDADPLSNLPQPKIFNSKPRMREKFTAEISILGEHIDDLAFGEKTLGLSRPPLLALPPMKDSDFIGPHEDWRGTPYQLQDMINKEIYDGLMRGQRVRHFLGGSPNMI
jgi:hypothetical protein